MTRSPDALKGLRHIQEVHQVVDQTLAPYDHYTPPDAPHALNVHIYNTHPTKTYIVRIYEVLDTVKMPKPRS